MQLVQGLVPHVYSSAELCSEPCIVQVVSVYVSCFKSPLASSLQAQPRCMDYAQALLTC